MPTVEEQETTVSAPRGLPVRIYTTVKRHLTTLRKDARVVELEGGIDWGSFEIPEELFDPLTGFRRQRKPLTADQRAAAADRLTKAREAKKEKA